METFTASEAKALIKAAIDSGAIKLSGPAGTKEYSEQGATNDATYLLTLLNALTKQP